MKTANKDYYAILEIPKTANEEQIKDAYRALAKKYHPDVSTGDAEKMKEVNVAYETLSDPVKRKTYDNPTPPRLGGFPFAAANPFGFTFNGTTFNFNTTAGATFHQQRIFNCDAFMSLKEMLLGNDKYEVTTPAGKIQFPLPPRTLPGQVISIKIASDAQSETFVKIQMNLTLPNNLTIEQQKKIEELGL